MKCQRVRVAKGQRNMKRLVLIIGLFIISLTFFNKDLFSQSPQEIYIRANSDYEEEHYENAVSLYERLIKIDKVGPEIFYNLGNSYFKLKKLGKAIINYERALRLAPRDRDVLFNLRLAREKIIDKIEVPQRGFLLNLLLYPYDKMNINELVSSADIIYLFIIILLIFSIFFVEIRRNFLYTIAVFVIFLILISVFGGAKIYNEEVIKSAIVISDKVDVRSGPKEDYLGQFTLHEGIKLRILKERQGWYEIDLSKDLRGWLPKDSVEVI